jgi:hypothetical protein
MRGVHDVCSGLRAEGTAVTRRPDLEISTDKLNVVVDKSHWTEWLRLALTTGPNCVGVSLSSLEEGNRSSFRNAVF